MEVILFRQILSVTTNSKMNSKAIIDRAITPKIASDCRTLFDLFRYVSSVHHDLELRLQLLSVNMNRATKKIEFFPT